MRRSGEPLGGFLHPPGEGGKGKGAGKGAAGPVPPLLRVRPVPEGALSQAQVRGLCPPGGHIWQGHVSQCWACHLPPFSGTSHAWGFNSYRGSIIKCLQDLWRNWARLNVCDLSEVPVTGLFGAAPVAVLPVPPGHEM